MTISPGTTINISGLTISNGRTPDGVPAPVFGGPGDSGGGIFNAGILTLADVIVTGNRTGNGAPPSSPSAVGTSFGGPGGSGGGIFSSGTLTMSNVTVSNNTTGDGAMAVFGGGGGAGAGIYVSSGSLTVTTCAVTGNTTAKGAIGTGDGASSGGGGWGAGIYINSGTVQITSSAVSNNTTGGTEVATPDNSGSGGSGGGISIVTGSLSITRSTISGNHTGDGIGFAGQGGFGGGIFNGGTLTVSESVINGNSTGSSGAGGGGVGGGIDNSATLTMTNTTVSGNSTSGAGGNGGGLWNAGSGTLANCSIVFNSSFSTFGGAGIHQFNSSSSVKIRNSIVAHNTLSNDPNGTDLDGNAPYNSQGHNLIGNADGSTGFNAVGDQIGSGASPLDPRLGTLANNGGPTQTHALLAGSPALDAGDNCVIDNTCVPAYGFSLTSDQRGAGFNRIVDGPDADVTARVDIGAFEAQVSLADTAGQTINEDGSLSLLLNLGGAASLTGVTATSSNTALVPNNPANISISGSGSTRTLSINPVANAFGTSTITLTVNGNNSQTMTDTFLLTVNSVNDLPSFTKGADRTINENDGAQTVNSWATNISAGPANEAGQTLSFIVTNNSNPGLFTVAPAISSSGTLTYTPATGASGTALITIALKDNGGTANGGVDTTATQSFNITVLEGGTLAFNSATFSVAEDGGTAVITINRSGGSAGTATVHFATSDGTATSGDYSSVSQTITFNNGEVSKTVSVGITDNLFSEPNETVNLTLSNAGGSGQLGPQATAVLTIVDNDPLGGFIRFSAANFNTTESSGSTTITVERLGDTSQAVTVNYATAEDSTVVPCAMASGIASSRCDFTTALGTLRFAAGESSKTFTVLISQDNYVEGAETLTITLSNLTGGAAFAAPSTATLTIADDAAEPVTNPIDDADKFVRQHYHDFLNREPDSSGLAFWTNQITECQQPGATCNAEVRRINVSAAFFLSIEFQQTGFLVERLYKVGFGSASGNSTFGGAHGISVPFVRFRDFLKDTQAIGQGVVVGQLGWEQVLENNKVAFTQEFVQRGQFLTSMSPSAFVDLLFLNAGVTPTASERDAVISEFGSATNVADVAARARAVRQVAENSTLVQQETNSAFVLMQYFGYLRRNPKDAPDTDYTGYDFWLTKLNQFNGNFVNAEMVKAFIISGEYRQRFGP